MSGGGDCLVLLDVSQVVVEQGIGITKALEGQIVEVLVERRSIVEDLRVRGSLKNSAWGLSNGRYNQE